MKYLPALSLALLLSATPSAPAGTPDQHPTRLATQARLDLTADAAVGTLNAGQVLEGDGTLTRMSWVPQAERPRGYTAQLPVTHLGWAKFALRFTPAKSGSVRLTLMGPWEEARKGLIYKQEVLWDDLRAEGASLAGGGFEAGGKLPAGWQGGGGQVVAATAK